MTSGETRSGTGEALPARFAGMAYRQPLRRFQELALDAFERVRSTGHRRAYLVLPPGAGKTVLGLEAARRLGRQTLVLTPNSAVQAQWLTQWQEFTPALVPATAEAALTAPVTVLTYQALCAFEADQESLDENARALWQSALMRGRGLPPDLAEEEIVRLETSGNAHFRPELARYRRKARSLIARGGQREELLALLHPNGRALVERLRASGPWTLVLDECHHLLETWGYLVRAVVEELGETSFVIGLTATPPVEMDAREERLYRQLFGHADFEALAPALVKEGILAPYQELAYFTQPFAHEEEFVAAQHERFERLQLRLLDPGFATCSFVEWIGMRVRDRRSGGGPGGGPQVGWGGFEREHPTLAVAALRFLAHHRLTLPEDVPLPERHRQPPTADDWVALIEDYCVGYLASSADPADEAAWEEIRHALPSLGYVLTRQGIRTYVSPVDRVLALSASKAGAALDILGAERSALGEHLRALVLCDYERAGRDVLAKLRGVLDPQAGSAALLLRILLAHRGVSELHPLLVTGRTVACSRACAAELVQWIEREVRELRGATSVETLLAADRAEDGSPAASLARQPRWEDVVVVRPQHPWWRPRRYVPLLTRFFENGRSRCLIGTRGLLGEGWDARRVNVLIDLTAATTSTAVHQMRGRSLRLDPALPRKVANNWDVVCVARDHPKGNADYERFVRKHRHYFAPTSDGVIESGVSHVHPDLSPFGPPAAHLHVALNRDMLSRARARETAYALWRVGEPYEDLAIRTVRVRAARADHLAVPRLLGRRPVGAKRGPGRGSSGFADAVLAAFGLVRRQGVDAALEDFGAAISAALRDAGAIRRVSPSPPAPDVRVHMLPDRQYRCYLEGATLEESALFTECLDELLGPLGEPRYLIPYRRTGFWDVVRARLGRTPDVDAASTYRPVPAYFAANRDRVDAFTRAWNRYVSPGRALYARDPRAQALLELHRGADPFGARTQVRTSWR